ncbi:hypothetical protein [Streptomyces sp. MMBL 11-3]|uniref:hypothetical protein n=1 Tax=Streptomyces sp. MMBL 11-3 TaxID=3382639 RepID=UPI0039B4245B
MSLLSTRFAAACVAAGAALTLFVSAGAAEARPSGFYVSLQPGSNIRSAPNTQGSALGNTGPTVDRYYQNGVCYVRGETVTAGGYTTNVWYYGDVFDGMSSTRYSPAYVWGGNVNIGEDPSDSVGLC